MREHYRIVVNARRTRSVKMGVGVPPVNARSDDTLTLTGSHYPADNRAT